MSKDTDTTITTNIHLTTIKKFISIDKCKECDFFKIIPSCINCSNSNPTPITCNILKEYS